MKTKILSTVALMLLTAACSTTAPRRHFEDIPLPSGLTYQPKGSVVIESPTVKAAKLVYRGRLEPVSLGEAMRTQLEASGWRHISRAASNDGVVQVFEKGGNALEVNIYEGLWFTYLALSASEALAPEPAQARDGGTQPMPGQATASLHTSVDPPAAPADQPARNADPSFTKRVKDFFANLLSW
jgi:hypothetical protein